ncbi:MAG: succinylglutamate desuccinylase/aspartoacylase family protein, partial [Saprospiraceae bacterium]|nr:succinylglutamate desuccinylase/aspartoacylase family protein [Saprospiraceae bacterium]
MPEGSGTKKKKVRRYKKGPLTISRQVIEPGEKAVVKVDVGQLPSDAPIHIKVFVHRSEKPGPVALIMGGVHGDEINGIEIVRRTLDSGIFDNLLRGSV